MLQELIYLATATTAAVIIVPKIYTWLNAATHPAVPVLPAVVKEPVSDSKVRTMDDVSADVAEVYADLARKHYNNDRRGDALQNYTKAIEVAPNAGKYYAGRAEVNTIVERYTAAVEDFDKAIQLNYAVASTYAGRATAKFKQQLFSEAMLDYNAAINLNSTEAAFYVGRGQTHMQLQQVPAAIKDFEQALKLQPIDHPDTADYYNALALARIANNDLTGALEALNAAINSNPKLAEPHRNRAYVQYLLEDYNAASKGYAEAIALGYWGNYIHQDLELAKEKAWDHKHYPAIAAKLLEDFKQIKAAKDRNCVLVIGETGSGKSTLVNYLLGAKLEAVTINHRPCVAVVGDELAKIGHSVSSETPIPELISNTTAGISFLDCPGFFDTRNEKQRISAAVNTKLAIDLTKSISGVIITLPCYALQEEVRLLSLRNLLDILCQFVDDVESLSNSAALVITKTPAEYLDEFKPQDVITVLNELYHALDITRGDQQHKLDALVDGAKDLQPKSAELQLTAKKLKLLHVLRTGKILIANVLDDGASRSMINNNLSDLLPIAKSNFDVVMDQRAARIFKYKLVLDTASQGVKLFTAGQVLQQRKTELEAQLREIDIDVHAAANPNGWQGIATKAKNKIAITKKVLEAVIERQQALLQQIDKLNTDEMELIEKSASCKQTIWSSALNIQYSGDSFDKHEIIMPANAKLMFEHVSPDKSDYKAAFYFSGATQETDQLNSVTVKFHINKKTKKLSRDQVKFYTEELAKLAARIEQLNLEINAKLPADVADVELAEFTWIEYATQQHELVQQQCNAVTAQWQQNKQKIQANLPIFNLLQYIIPVLNFKSAVLDDFSARLHNFSRAPVDFTAIITLPTTPPFSNATVVNNDLLKPRDGLHQRQLSNKK